MYSTAHQAATRPSSHKEGEVSERARRDFRPGYKTTLKFNAAHSDACGQTESESERAGPSIAVGHARRGPCRLVQASIPATHIL